jgi:hypothetical protein
MIINQHKTFDLQLFQARLLYCSGVSAAMSVGLPVLL